MLDEQQIETRIDFLKGYIYALESDACYSHDSNKLKEAKIELEVLTKVLLDNEFKETV